MTVFEQVKEAVDMRTVAEGYGLHIDRAGMCLCPFHAEKTPSAKVYPHNIYCFGCGTSAEVSEYHKCIARRRACEEWEKQAWRMLHDYLWLMRQWRELVQKNPDDVQDERFVYSLYHIDYAEYLCDEFIHADRTERLAMRETIKNMA